jgi:hypothetical protein
MSNRKTVSLVFLLAVVAFSVAAPLIGVYLVELRTGNSGGVRKLVKQSN